MRTRVALLFAFLLAVVSFVTASPAAASRLGPLPASFSGLLPCADCQGLRYQMNLYPGGSYLLVITYLRDGENETIDEMGSFSLDRDTTRLVLDSSDPKAGQFEVTDASTLRKLDREGRAIESSLNYQLEREPALLPLELRLKLTGEYFYMADAGVLTECRSGLRLPVLPDGAAHALERAFLAEKSVRDSLAAKAKSSAKSGSKNAPPTASEPPLLLVRVLAHVAARPPAGVEGDRPTVSIERLLESYPNESCGARGVTHPLEGTRWVLTRIGKTAVRLAPGQREPMLGFDRMADRVSGYSGCNRFTASYTLGSAGYLSLGPIAGSRMACVGPDLETPFLQALGRVQRYRISGAHLELLDSVGVVQARFEARDL